MSKRQRILVVDDDVQVVDTVETLLQSVGYETIHAYRTEAGMDLARQNKPDLMLLDVMFSGPPGPDGFETSRLIQGDPELKGIPPEKKGQLFQRFSRLDTTPAASGKKGTGLGLFICKEIVEKHGGQIWADSKVGEWAKFSFTLPNGAAHNG